MRQRLYYWSYHDEDNNNEEDATYEDMMKTSRTSYQASHVLVSLEQEFCSCEEWRLQNIIIMQARIEASSPLSQLLVF